ncbi:hypothetical protein VNO78_20041 [Psophocarpus tetragonolobus]|uniref:Uncharacterized protein n=1 Tax=Psophocarpus tetragonolobus TaxID=3891 RepID=A0AAN9S8P8_PSOTE
MKKLLEEGVMTREFEGEEEPVSETRAPLVSQGKDWGNGDWLIIQDLKRTVMSSKAGNHIIQDLSLNDFGAHISSQPEFDDSLSQKDEMFHEDTLGFMQVNDKQILVANHCSISASHIALHQQAISFKVCSGRKEWACTTLYAMRKLERRHGNPGPNQGKVEKKREQLQQTQQT